MVQRRLTHRVSILASPSRRVALSDAADLLGAIAAVLWVAFAFVALLVLRRLLASQEGSLKKIGIGPGGVNIEWAEAKLDQWVAKSEQDAGKTVGDAAKRAVIDRLRSHANILAQARILWVDDHPENNTPLVELLQRFGATVDQARSNPDAFRLLSSTRYDVVISDVGRDDEGEGSDLKGVELAKTVFERWGQKILLFTLRFDPARVPGLSDQKRLELVKDVERCVFARTKGADEGLHYILDVLERSATWDSGGKA